MRKIIILFAILLLTSCAPSPEAIRNAISQTEQAASTSTSTPEPSSTPTLTPSRTPSPTPDLRVIDVDPEKLLLTRHDIPIDGQYYIPDSTWKTPHRNSEIISGWGAEEGQEYLEETERVDGWLQWLARGTSRVVAPEQIYHNVILYSSIEGARRASIDEYSICLDMDEDLVVITSLSQIGEDSWVCKEQVMEASGPRVTLVIEYRYRNVKHVIYIWGWAYEVTQSFLEEIAQNLIIRMDSLPLSENVTFSP